MKTLTPSTTYQHWIDALVAEIIGYWGKGTKEINCSCGLSVSGLQHVGRLRGEVTLTNTVMHQLRQSGIQTRHAIVRYTSDQWKGKLGQIDQFSDKKEAEGYIGQRLIDVPDPKGELASWVDRYWLDFGGYLDDFSRDAEIFSTHEIYSWPEMHELVRYAIEHRDKARVIINKYRIRNPYQKDWIPVLVVCQQCQRIDTTKVVSVDPDAYTAQYRCDNCGEKGTTSIETGKLSWRLEWAALWKVLNVGFEPFGKDHATPGGSRDSAKELAETFFNFKPPVPYAYEWVGLIDSGVDKGDMGSSDFLGFTPKTWLSVAPGEPLRYLFLKNKPMKRITLGLEYVPSYIGQFERAERVYYNIDSPKAPEQEIADIRRSYELANLEPISEKAPLQVPYLHAVLLSQVIPTENLTKVAIEKLTSSAILPPSLTDEQQDYLKERLTQANTWVRNFAPESYRITVLLAPPKNLNRDITPELRALYQQLHSSLNPQQWTERAITDATKTITQTLAKSTQQDFFRFMYQAFFGRDRGPRISAFFAFTDPELVLDRLQYLASPPK